MVNTAKFMVKMLNAVFMRFERSKQNSSKGKLMVNGIHLVKFSFSSYYYDGRDMMPSSLPGSWYTILTF